MRKRSTHDGRFKQLQVWQYLKECKGAAPRMIAALLGVDGVPLSTSATCRLLRRMVDRGSVIAAGETHHRIYKAGRNEPTDRRGRHPQVVVNLRHGPQVSAVAKATRKGKLYVPPAKHALDEAMRQIIAKWVCK